MNIVRRVRDGKWMSLVSTHHKERYLDILELFVIEGGAEKRYKKLKMVRSTWHFRDSTRNVVSGLRSGGREDDKDVQYGVSLGVWKNAVILPICKKGS